MKRHPSITVSERLFIHIYHFINQFKAGGNHVQLQTGAAANVAANSIAARSTQQRGVPPPVQPNSQSNQPPGKGNAAKETYNINIKELNKIESKAEETSERPLRRHWSNVSFYLMASLSIVLPVLFLSTYPYNLCD